MIFFCTLKIHLYSISESYIKEELSMNEAQVVWTKKKLLEMDIYITNKGLLKMSNEDWQHVVAMGDKIVADSKDNEAVRNAVLGNLEMWENAWREEISNFKKKIVA